MRFEATYLIRMFVIYRTPNCPNLLPFVRECAFYTYVEFIYLYTFFDILEKIVKVDELNIPTTDKSASLRSTINSATIFERCSVSVWKRRRLSLLSSYAAPILSDIFSRDRFGSLILMLNILLYTAT